MDRFSPPHLARANRLRDLVQLMERIAEKLSLRTAFLPRRRSGWASMPITYTDNALPWSNRRMSALIAGVIGLEAAEGH